LFFEIRGQITDILTIATGSSIRELPRLRKLYGKGRWRKRKGFAAVRLPKHQESRDTLVRGICIGKREFKSSVS
jgi:hypothetical protein